MRPTLIIVAASVAAVLTAVQAEAQANRTFVSGHGSDSNPCSLAAPCRSFAQALTQTNAGGEITILDPAGYGSVTIAKSVSIVNDAVGEAGVTVTSGNAITIAIGANDVVDLRGLTLVGGGVGAVGISFTNLGTFNIQNCVIRGFIDQGIDLDPAGNAQFNITDTIVSDVTGLFANGIAIVTSGSGTVTGVFNRVQATDASTGFFINGGSSSGAVDVTIANSIASNNVNGVHTQSTTGQANTQVVVVNSVVTNNGIGIVESGGNSTTYLAGNTIAGNTTAFSNFAGGALFSFGNNNVKSNSDDGGAISLVSTK